MKRGINLLSLAILAILFGVPAYTEKLTEAKQAKTEPQDQPEQEQAIVGRITFLEKNLFRYLQEAKDWALAARDMPVVDGDVLYADIEGRSEFSFPNNTKIRINDKTKIQIDGVKENLTSIYVNSGTAQIQNRSADTVVRVDTPFGQVVSNQPSVFDVYVGDSSAIVTGINGTAKFVDGRNHQYDVRSNADSLLADQNSVASSRRYLDSRWDAWNNQMNAEAKKAEQNPSPYLPEQLQPESQVLAENGNWEQLTYNGETASYWTPQYVAAGWSPFTVGRWTTWYGEQLWIPYEPFGWVTHHHGGWIFYRGRWYWRPPIRTGWRIVPWYPARVCWVHHGRHIGWVPLTVYEPYYGRRYWGPRTVIYNERVIVKSIEVHKYVNVNRVVVIDKDRLYGTHGRYQTVRDANVVRQVVNDGQAAPGLTREVVRGADLKMEHHFARTGDLSRKPRPDQVKEFETRRKNFADRNESAGAIVQRFHKASLKTPETRTNQALPFGKAAHEFRRELPEPPRQIQKQARRPQPDQHEPSAPQKVELQRQQQPEHPAERQRQPQEAQLQRQLQEAQRRQQAPQQQLERQKQQQDGKQQKQTQQQKQGHRQPQ